MWALGNAYWARYAADHLRLSPIPASVLPERSLPPVFLHAITQTLHHVWKFTIFESLEDQQTQIKETIWSPPQVIHTVHLKHCMIVSVFSFKFWIMDVLGFWCTITASGWLEPRWDMDCSNLSCTTAQNGSDYMKGMISHNRKTLLIYKERGGVVSWK